MTRFKPGWKALGRLTAMIIADIILISAMSLASLLLIYSLKFHLIPQEAINTLTGGLIVICSVYVSVFALFRLYGSLWEFAGVVELTRIIEANIIATVVLLFIFQLTNSRLPIAFFLINAVLVMNSSGWLRLYYRLKRRVQLAIGNDTAKYSRVMLIGAGRMGTIMVQELQNESYKYGKPVIFVDDDPEKQRKKYPGSKDCRSVEGHSTVS